MTDEHNDEGGQRQARRSTLRTLLTGGGVVTLSALPAQWVKPVVDAVVLPTHAQTSPEDAPNGIVITGLMGMTTPRPREPSWWERIIPTAYAGEPFVDGFSLCIESPGGSSYTASATEESSGVTVTGDGKIGECVRLSCGDEYEIYLRVTDKNPNGSFDFELHGSPDCDSQIYSGTTNKPCNVSTKECDKPD